MNEGVGSSFGSVLRFFRQRKGMSQGELAGKLEMHENSVSLWERDLERSESHSVVLKIAKLLDLDEEEKLLLLEARYGTASILPLYNMPFERNPYFTGRDLVLEQLHDGLTTKKQVVLKQAISGLGGIGKTQTALEYAYRYQTGYHTILWAAADSEEALIGTYIRLAQLLRLPEKDQPDQKRIVAAVKHWLSTHKRWLLILDNVTDLGLVDKFVPPGRQGAVLLTTQRQSVARIAQIISLDVMPEDEGTLFLLRRTQRLKLDMTLEKMSCDDAAIAKNIVQELGGLPLALDQAGAYILEVRCSFAEYLNLLKKHRAELLQRREGKGMSTDHPDSVTTTFTLNFQQVQQQSEMAADLLRVCAFLAPDGIAEEIFHQGASHLGQVLQSLGSDDGWLLNQAIEVLHTFSLVQRDPKQNKLSIHRLVQVVLQDTMLASDQEIWARRIIRILETFFLFTQSEIDKLNMTHPSSEEYSLTLLVQRNHLYSYIFYVFTCLTDMPSRVDVYPDLASLLFRVAEYYDDMWRDYYYAELLYLRALSIWEQALGPDHPYVVSPLIKLSNIYRKYQKSAKAKQFYRRASQIIKKQPPRSDHLDTWSSLYDLFWLCLEMKKYADAEPLGQRMLSFYEQTGGLNQPGAASHLNNLGFVYFELGKYAEAETLYQQAISIHKQYQTSPWPWEKDLHYLDFLHDVLLLHNLALVYFKQGRYAEAESFYQQAISTRTQRLGSQHPDTRATRKHYVSLLRTLDRHKEAALLEATNAEQGKGGEEQNRVAGGNSTTSSGYPIL